MTPRRALVLLVAALLSLPLAGCGLFHHDPTPADGAQAFLDAWSRGDDAAASRATDDPAAALTLLDRIRQTLRPVALRTGLGPVRSAGDTASFTANWDLGGGRIWSYPGALDLRQAGNAWTVHWAPGVVHPQLAAQQTLAVRETPVAPAPVVDRAGVPLLAPQTVVSVLLDRRAAGDLPAVAGALAGALGPIDPSITTQAITDGSAKVPDGQGYQVAALRDSDYQQVRAVIHDLPGVRFTTQTRLLAPDPAFARQVLPGIRDAVAGQLNGRAGWRVVTVGAGGEEILTLHEEPPQPGSTVTTTLDRGVQAAAEDAVEPLAQQTVLVALQPSTGDVLAVAQNGPADAAGPIALAGRYPPGSTFKIVTAAAALQAGTVTPDSPLGCPGTTVIAGQRVVPNAHQFDLGTVPLHTAFARSCNTTFSQLAAGLAPDALPGAALSLGLGADYRVPGITTVTGSVPPPTDVVERAEDGFGQGRVLTSPFGMALVVATVARGGPVVPQLVGGHPTEVIAASGTLPDGVFGALRPMMREVVTAGTATAIAGPGEPVYGKTGTAQFGDGTHSHGWFVGFRGDLAFAVLIVDGGDSTPAVLVAKRFLAAVG